MVLLFGVFSSSCYALETNTDFYINYRTVWSADGVAHETGYRYNNSSAMISSFSVDFTMPATFSDSIYLKSNTATPIVSSDTYDYTVNINSFVCYSTGAYNNFPNYIARPTPKNFRVTTYGTDYSETYEINDYTLRASGNGNWSLSFDISRVSLFDVFSMRISFDTEWSYLTSGIHYYGFTTDGDSVANVTIESKEVGLLEGILYTLDVWFSDIYDSITLISDTMFIVIEFIADLPDMIVEKLIDFFLPDEQFIADYKDNFDTLFSDHLGALYQSVDAFESLYDSFSAQVDSQDSIEMPVVNVSLAGTNFSFGGYTVDLIPDKFEPIVNILKTLLGIVATLLFVNMLKKRYEGVVSK